MDTGLPLWDSARPKRANVPATSRLAYYAMAESGQIGGHRAVILERIRRHPGQTAVELAGGDALDDHDLDRVQIGRRLIELEGKRLIRRGEPRICSVNRRKMLTWWPVAG